MKKLAQVRAVEVLESFLVRLQFSDGATKEIDLSVHLHGPIFAPLRDDPEFFRSVRVDAELGTIVWPNGADIDPDVLYYGLTPAWMELKPIEHG
jgi:hypothetical protein